MDLGAWASNAYAIPDQPVDFDELDRLSSQNEDAEKGKDE